MQSKHNEASDHTNIHKQKDCFHLQDWLLQNDILDLRILGRLHLQIFNFDALNGNACFIQNHPNVFTPQRESNKTVR